MAVTVEQVNDALRAVMDPETCNDLVAARAVRNLRLEPPDAQLDFQRRALGAREVRDACGHALQRIALSARQGVEGFAEDASLQYERISGLSLPESLRDRTERGFAA